MSSEGRLNTSLQGDPSESALMTRSGSRLRVLFSSLPATTHWREFKKKALCGTTSENQSVTPTCNVRRLKGCVAAGLS